MATCVEVPSSADTTLDPLVVSTLKATYRRRPLAAAANNLASSGPGYRAQNRMHYSIKTPHRPWAY